MGASPVTYRGVILSSTEYKEKDRVLKFLTRDNGLIDIYVKGTGKLNSTNAFTSVPFMVCDLVVADSHGYLYLRSGSIVESNSKIMTDLDAIIAASHFSKILIDVSGQSDNCREAYELAVFAFYNLASDTSKWKLFTAAFNWRILTILGFTVSYSSTNDTLTAITDNGLYYVSVSGGDIYSGRKTGSEYCVLSGVALKALNFISSCDIQKLFSITGSDSLTDSLYGFTDKYIKYQIG